MSHVFPPQNFIGFDVASPGLWKGNPSREVSFFSMNNPREGFPHKADLARFCNSTIPRAPYSAYAVSHNFEDHGFVPIRTFLTFAFLEKSDNNARVSNAKDFYAPHARLLESILDCELFFEMLAGDALVSSFPIDVPFSSFYPPYNILMASIHTKHLCDPVFLESLYSTIIPGGRAAELSQLRSYQIRPPTDALSIANHQTLLSRYISIHSPQTELFPHQTDTHRLPDPSGVPLSLFALPVSSALLLAYPPIFSIVNSIHQQGTVVCGEYTWADLMDSDLRMCFLSFPIPVQRRFIIPPHQGGDHRIKIMKTLPSDSILGDFFSQGAGEICLSVQYEVVQNAFRSPAFLARYLDSLPNMDLPRPYWMNRPR